MTKEQAEANKAFDAAYLAYKAAIQASRPAKELDALLKAQQEASEKVRELT